MIKIFGPKDNNFNSNGIVTFKPFKLVETKKISLNGWHLEIDAPLEYEEYLKQDMLCVVKVKSRLNPQAFRIKNTKKTQRKITFEAEHVMFDARNYFLLDARPTNMSAVGALTYINERTDINSPFSFSSDVNNSATAYFIRKNLLEALAVIEERWGGYYEADNWHISLKKNVGQDRGEVISYGKNLESIQVTEDWSNVVTKLYPVGFDGLLIPEKYLESEIKYDQPYTKTIQFETEFEEEERTVENLLPELMANAQAYLEKNQYPMVNYEVKSNINEFMEIGDTIHVKHPLVDIKTQVQEYTYDILTKRTTSLVFGNYSRDVKKKFESIRNDLETLKGNKSVLEAIIGNQTDLINNLNKNGHVVIDDNQILILDKLPKENTKYVWRWNMGGLAFSENGVEGPYKQAWTIDGVFNTDFISAGSIVTNHLASDVGSALDISSNDAINLLTDSMNDASSSISILEDVITTEIERRLTSAEGTIENINETVSTVESTQQTFTDRITNLEGEMTEQQTFFRTEIDGLTIGGTDWKTVMHADGERISFQSQAGDVEAQFGAGGMYVNRWETDFHTIEKFEEGSAKGTIFKNRKGGS